VSSNDDNIGFASLHHGFKQPWRRTPLCTTIHVFNQQISISL